MWITYFSAGALALLTPDASAEVHRCGVDEAEGERLLALDWESFDQDASPGGWRAIAQRAGCFAAAADLIVLYIAASTALPQPDTHQISSLRWHAGQMRAMAGSTDAALAHFRGAYDAPGAEAGSSADWNSYVDATIAFLTGDRSGLEAAQARLAAQAIPQEMISEREAYIAENPGTDPPPLKPPFLPAVERLAACFGAPYRLALAAKCELERRDDGQAGSRT